MPEQVPSEVQEDAGNLDILCDLSSFAHASEMIIEDPEAFKTWLTSVLKPICEADPEALAKYVIALVKKDKSTDALRQSMINQLQVFLQDETKPFVDQLFRTLEKHEYKQPGTLLAPPPTLLVIPNANPPNPLAAVPALSKSEMPTKVPLIKPIIPVAEIASAITETLNGKGVIVGALLKHATANNDADNNNKNLKAFDKDKDKENQSKAESKVDKDKERRRSRHRSRSRSWERNRRSRSRDRLRSRALWRNKSPTYRPNRRRSLSPAERAQRSRSRSPRHGNYRGRYRNRSPPRPHSYSRSRSRSTHKEEAAAPVPPPGATSLPSQEPPHKPVDDKPPPPPVKPDFKRRCRDYDEEGYCMRGGMCPYDHGVDAVVLEDSALSRVLYPNGTNDSILGPPPPMHMPPPPPAEYNPLAPQVWRGPPPFRGGGPPHRGMPPRMPMPFQGPQRELIAVPVLGGADAPPMGDKYPFHGPPPPPGNHIGHQGYMPEFGNMFKKKQFDFNRLGPRKNPTNCSLELKKVPTGLNNIMHLNNHFAKFGKIVNIQVSYEGDPEAAIVTFSSHAEANAAYRSTEAVLNNRFIKVFWHAGNGQEGSKDPGANMAPNMNMGPRPVKERLGKGNLAPNTHKFILAKNDAEPKGPEVPKPQDKDADVSDKEKENQEEAKVDARAQANLAIKKGQELLAAKEKLKKSAEEKRKEALKLTQDLRKRKQDLLEKQLAQQKLLIGKMDKCAAGAQRDLLLQTIIKSQEAIELVRKDLAETVQALKTGPPTPVAPTVSLIKRNKEAIQKELLDAELDLISKQAEGVDTLDLQKKLWDLKALAGVGGAPVAPPASLRGRGRRFNPLGRHKLVKNNLNADASAGKLVGVGGKLKTTIDHRPTKLLISGYEQDEQESVLTHFRQFGEIVDYASDDALPSVTVNYRTRKEAELAVNKGKHFQDRTLTITWQTPSSPLQLQRTTSRTVLISESDEDQLMDAGDEDAAVVELSEDVLLQDDEEEEEENEDRSWRR